MSDHPPPDEGLLVVLAHPDDESFACGGTIALCAGAGHRVTLVCLSRGAAGPLDPALAMDRAELPALRERELNEAAHILGIDDVLVLGYRDGILQWEDRAAVEADIRAAIASCRPAVVITFGADGLYWHPDHIAVFERTQAAVDSSPEPRPALYHVTLPQGAMRGLADAARARAPFAADSFWGVKPEVFGLAAPAPTLVVDVRPVIARKIQALRAHRSQFATDHPLRLMDLDDATRWLGREQFTRAAVGAAGPTFLDRFASPTA